MKGFMMAVITAIIVSVAYVAIAVTVGFKSKSAADKVFRHDRIRIMKGIKFVFRSVGTLLFHFRKIILARGFNRVNRAITMPFIAIGSFFTARWKWICNTILRIIEFFYVLHDYITVEMQKPITREMLLDIRTHYLFLLHRTLSLADVQVIYDVLVYPGMTIMDKVKLTELMRANPYAIRSLLVQKGLIEQRGGRYKFRARWLHDQIHTTPAELIEQARAEAAATVTTKEPQIASEQKAVETTDNTFTETFDESFDETFDNDDMKAAEGIAANLLHDMTEEDEIDQDEAMLHEAMSIFFGKKFEEINVFMNLRFMDIFAELNNCRHFAELSPEQVQETCRNILLGYVFNPLRGTDTIPQFHQLIHRTERVDDMSLPELNDNASCEPEYKGSTFLDINISQPSFAFLRDLSNLDPDEIDRRFDEHDRKKKHKKNSKNKNRKDD